MPGALVQAGHDAVFSTGGEAPYYAYMVTDDGTDTPSYMAGYEVAVDTSETYWQFTPTADFNGEVEFSYQITDGTSDPVDATASIYVMADDDAPEITGPEIAVAMTEDEGGLIEGISISDVDDTDADDVLQVTLSVGGGQLTLDANAAGGPSWMNSVVVSGTKADINSEISALTYKGFGATDSDALLITVMGDDPINPGTLTTLSTQTVALTVTQIADPPEQSYPPTIEMVMEDGTRLISESKLLMGAYDEDTPLSDLSVVASSLTAQFNGVATGTIELTASVYKAVAY